MATNPPVGPDPPPPTSSGPGDPFITMLRAQPGGVTTTLWEPPYYKHLKSGVNTGYT